MKEETNYFDSKDIANFLQKSDFVTIQKTVQNNEIRCFIPAIQENVPKIMLIGGVHGDEKEGVVFMYEFSKEFLDVYHSKQVNNIFSDWQFYLIPICNPDGFLKDTRKNANQIDLNRNLPTKDWTSHFEKEKYYPGIAACSELENQALVQAIDTFQPDFIISFHSWKPVINVNGDCMRHALRIQKQTNLQITEDIGYPTPGSLGTYAGIERKIPTITLEIERGMPLKEVYPKFRQGVIDSFLEVRPL